MLVGGGVLEGGAVIYKHAAHHHGCVTMPIALYLLYLSPRDTTVNSTCSNTVCEVEGGVGGCGC
jgi:hypothetical protein